MTDSLPENLFNSLVTNNIETLEKLSEQIGKLDKLAEKLNVSSAPDGDWQKRMGKLETHLTNQLAIEFSQLSLQLQKIGEVQPQKTSPTRSFPLYWGIALLAVLFISVGSLYYLSSKQFVSEEFLRTYTFGQQMKTVWAKLSKQEKQKLAKMIE